MVGRLDGLAHLLDLPLVLGEAQVDRKWASSSSASVRSPRVGAVLDAGGVELAGQVAVGVADQPHGHLAGVLDHGVGELVDVARGHPELGLDVLDGRTRADPELAVAGVGEELVAVATGERAEVEDRLVAVVAGLEHQHGVGLAVAAEPGQVGEGGVRPEHVVGVVAAHLEATGGDDQPVALGRRR